MNVLDRAKMKVLESVATKNTQGKSWAQTVDFACAMLGVTERHIDIDSSRAVVHVSFTQLARRHVLDITFQEILQAVNGPSAGPARGTPDVRRTGRRSDTSP